MAASGAPGVTGDPDRPPLFFPVPQAMMEGGSDAAIAALAALAARDRDGLGQSGYVSERISAMMSAMSQHLAPPSGNPETQRSFGAMTIAGVQIPSMYQCADGFVMISVAFGPVFGQMTQRLAKWAADESHLARNIAEISWPAFFTDLQQKKVTPADLAALIEGLKSLTRNKTKAEFGAAARKLGLLASPVFSMKDVAESAQYRERGLFTSVNVGGTRDRRALALRTVLEFLDRNAQARADAVGAYGRDPRSRPRTVAHRNPGTLRAWGHIGDPHGDAA